MGSGKSTLISFLVKHFDIKPLLEPNDENPYLADFYNDMSRWAFHSQVFFLIRKFHLHQEMTDSPGPVLLDRSIYEDAEIFAKLLYRRGTMAKREFATYWSLYQTLVQLLKPPDLLIYLKCSLWAIKRRISLRGRPEEAGVSHDYLKDLQRAYSRWFARYDRSQVLVIRSDKLNFVGDLVHQAEVLSTIERVLRGES